MILLENVRKIYKAKSGDVTAVDNANLKIDKGEIFGVIGYSGAGKSSLIRLFNQLEKPTSTKLQLQIVSFQQLQEANFVRQGKKLNDFSALQLTLVTNST